MIPYKPVQDAIRAKKLFLSSGLRGESICLFCKCCAWRWISL